MLCQIGHIIKHMMLPVFQLTLINAVILQPGSAKPFKGRFKASNNNDYRDVKLGSSSKSSSSRTDCSCDGGGEWTPGAGVNSRTNAVIRRYSADVTAQTAQTATVLQIVRDVAHRVQ